MADNDGWEVVAGPKPSKGKKRSKPRKLTDEEREAQLVEAGVRTNPLEMKPTQFEEFDKELERKAKAKARLAAEKKSAQEEADAAAAQASEEEGSSFKPRAMKNTKAKGKGKGKGKKKASGEDLQAKVVAMSSDTIEVVIDNAREKFGGDEKQILRAVADALVTSLSGAILTPDDDPHAPLSYLKADNPSVFECLEKALLSVSPSLLAGLFAESVKQLVSVTESQRPKQKAGVQLLIQTLVGIAADHGRAIVLPSFRAVMDMFHKQLPALPVAEPCVWAYSQAADRLPATYLTVWFRLMLPILRDTTASKNLKVFATSYLPRLLSRRDVFREILLNPRFAPPTDGGEAPSLVSSKQFVAVLFLLSRASDNAKKLPESCINDLRAAFRLLSAIVAVQNPEPAFRAVLPLGHSGNEELSTRTVGFLYACLTRSPPCHAALVEMYQAKTANIAPCVQLFSTLRRGFDSPRSPAKLLGRTLLDTVQAIMKQNVVYAEQCKGDERLEKFLALSNEHCIDLSQRLHKQGQTGSGLLFWLIMVALFASVVAFVLLGTHFLCVFHPNLIDDHPSICKAAQDSGMMSAIDGWYKDVAPVLEPHVKNAIAFATPYVSAASAHASDLWTRAEPTVGPYVAQAAVYGGLAREQLGFLMTKAAPYVAQLQAFVGELATKASPCVQQALAALAQLLHAVEPYFTKFLQGCAQAIDDLRPYAKQAWALAVEYILKLKPLALQLQERAVELLQQSKPFVDAAVDGTVTATKQAQEWVSKQAQAFASK